MTVRVGHMTSHDLLTFDPAVTAKSCGSIGEKCTLVTAADSFATIGNCGQIIRAVVTGTNRPTLLSVGPVFASPKVDPVQFSLSQK